MSKKTNESVVVAICKQTTIPKNATIIRLPGNGNARPSAVAPPFIKPPLNWSTPPPGNAQLLPPDEAIVVVTNDILHACMFTDKNPLSVPLSQQWVFSGSPDVTNIVITPGGSPPLATDLYCTTPIGAARQWHGPRLYALLHKGKYYAWCDAPAAAAVGNNIQVQLGGTAMQPTDSMNISIYRLNEGDEILVSGTNVVGPFPAGAILVTQNIAPADWYRVEITGGDNNTTAALGVAILNNAVSEIVVHQAMPDLTERMLNLVQSSRVLGAAVHAINLVSDQNATGSWVGDQPAGSILYTTFLRGAAGANGFQALTRNRGNELMELKKYNPYCWVCPESEKSWSYRNPFSFNAAGGVTNIMNDDASTFDYVVLYLKAGGTGVGADPARNLQLEFFYNVEYLSEGLWMNPGVSPASADDQDAARKVLTSMENIGHNPAFDDIMRTIGKYVRLSAPVLALLGPYGKAASAVATGVGEGLRILGYRTKQRAREDGAYTGLLPLKKRYREDSDVEEAEEERGNDV